MTRSGDGSGRGSGPASGAGITQQVATVVANEPAGAYRRILLSADRIAAAALPGQFVACAVGAEDGSGALLLRRAFSLHRADPAAGTIEIVVAPHAPGTEWICRRVAGHELNVVGPGGQGFRPPGAGAAENGSAAAADDSDRGSGAASPSGSAATFLVGGGYGAAPLTWFGEQLAQAGHPVTIITGAASADRLFGHEPGALPVRVATEDGSLGTRGLVTDVLADLLAAHDGPAAVYACGPMGMLRAVHRVAEQHGASSQLAVEESMACGVGVCMTCVLPVVGSDGVTRMTRSCVDGPVFEGTSLRWDAIDVRPGGTTSRVPEDCLGAPLPMGGQS